MDGRNGGDLNFAANLFKAADKLRGNLEPSEYKHVALGLIFLKYISDSFEAQHVKFSGDEYAACDAGYRQGFADGDQIRDAALQRAWQIGNDDAKAGQENASFDHPDAGGTCRIQWTQHYNRGHFQGRSP